MIECSLNGHTYQTEKLYLEDFKKLGIIYEEKIMPFLITALYCSKEENLDKELILALYTASKEVFKREDVEFLMDLAMNQEHLIIDGKKLDRAEWEKHWQEVGYIDYRLVALLFTKENLGNFSMLSALLPEEWTVFLNEFAKEKFSNLFEKLNRLLKKL